MVIVEFYTYTEKPKNVNVTPEQRAKAEQAFLPYVNKAVFTTN